MEKTKGKKEKREKGKKIGEKRKKETRKKGKKEKVSSEDNQNGSTRVQSRCQSAVKQTWMTCG